MSIRLIATLAVVAIMATAALGKEKTETEKCLQSIKDAKVNLTKTEDTGRPGEKIEKEAMELFPIAQRLCEEGKYDDTEKLVAYLRHLLAD